MIKWLFTINGEDFSDVVSKYGYETDTIPVYSRCITTIDGVDHEKLIRMRGKLSVTTNPVIARRAAEFCTALRSLPAKIGYHNFQMGQDVEQVMKTDGMPLAHVMQNSGVDWLDKTKITFTEQ